MAYRGFRVPIVAGAGGFNGGDNQARIPETDLLTATNLSFEGDAWRKVGGLTKFNANAITGTPVVLGAYEWRPTSTVQRIITACDDGSIYKEVAGDLDSVTLTSGHSFTKPVLFAEGGQEGSGDDRKLFIFSENVEPQVIAADAAGGTSAAITTPPASWGASNYPAGGLHFQGQMLAYATPEYPHALWGSTFTDHEDWGGAGSFATSVWTGEGDRIAAVIPFLSPKTTGVSRLYIFKYPLGMYYVDLSDPTSIYTVKVRDDIGMASPLAWCRVGNDILFQSSTGSIHSLLAVNSSEDLSATDISAQLNLRSWIQSNIYKHRLTHSVATYDEQRKEVKFAFSSNSDSDGGTPATYTNGTIIHADLKYPNSPRLSIHKDHGLIYETIFKYRKTNGDIALMCGGVGGLIYELNQQNRTHEGPGAYSATFRTTDSDLGFFAPELKGRDKRFDYIEMVNTPTGNYSISIDVYIDGEFSETVTMLLGVDDALYGTGVFGTAKYGGNFITTHKEKINGHGERIGIAATNSGDYEDFSISEFAYYCQVSSTRGER